MIKEEKLCKIKNQKWQYPGKVEEIAPLQEKASKNLKVSFAILLTTELGMSISSLLNGSYSTSYKKRSDERWMLSWRASRLFAESKEKH